MEAGRRMCEYCKRWFPNGKSLGGHMKCHLSLTNPRGTPGSASNSPKPQKKNKAPSSSTGEEYKCLLCRKSYVSWRSFKGHVRWHQIHHDSNCTPNKSWLSESESEEPETKHAAQMLVNLSNKTCSCKYAEFEEGDLLKRKHECAICQKNFPSGQALGGHMRTHTSLVLPDASITVVVPPKPDLGFDLNVEPPEEVSGKPSDDVIGEVDANKNASN